MSESASFSARQQLVWLCVIVLPLVLIGWLVSTYSSVASTEKQRDRQSEPRPVVTTQVAMHLLPIELEAFGNLRARRSVRVTTATSGRVTGINFSGGQQVEAGDVLLTLDTALQLADVEEAKARLQEMDLELGRAQQLKNRQAGSQQSVDSARARRAGAVAELARSDRLFEQRTVRAEFAGVAGLPQVAAGEFIDSTTVITSLDDLHTMTVDFGLPESSYGQVAKSQAVTVHTEAAAGKAFVGTVSAIDSRIDANTGTFQVRAVLPNEDQKLRVGMFVQVLLKLGERTALMVPEEALVPEGSRSYVVSMIDEIAQRNEVTTGRRIAGMVEIIDGITNGATIVTQGHSRLKNGDRIVARAAGV